MTATAKPITGEVGVIREHISDVRTVTVELAEPLPVSTTPAGTVPLWVRAVELAWYRGTGVNGRWATDVGIRLICDPGVHHRGRNVHRRVKGRPLPNWLAELVTRYAPDDAQ
jgi:hypothetical protein